MSEEDQKELRSWADKAYIIRNHKSINKKEKLKRLKSITKESKVTIKFFKAFFKFIKMHTWDESGWPARMAQVGLTVGTAVSGTKMAVIASAGIGIAAPIYVLSSAGEALIGTILQEIKNK